MIAAEPALDVFSAIHSISLRRVTTTNQTFIEWQTDFSSDADTAVVRDEGGERKAER